MISREWGWIKIQKSEGFIHISVCSGPSDLNIAIHAASIAESDYFIFEIKVLQIQLWRKCQSLLNKQVLN